MPSVKLKIAELRKLKGISQQELAEYLGVSFQSVSKWETGATMPDITLLPDIAEYFKVSVDELLGLKPLHQLEYRPRNSDNHDGSTGKYDNLYKNRKYFWNDDYLEFLVRSVWKLKHPVDFIEFRCCDGYLGQQLLSILPQGSSYTGIDTQYFTEKARLRFQDTDYDTSFLPSDLYSFEADRLYDIAIIQASLRHMNRPIEVLKKMIASVKRGGLIICIDVNREFENDGLYIEGMDYNYLCTAFDYHKIWEKELEQEGRDYAIGMRLPFYMKQLGLQDIDVRMNDKVQLVTPDRKDYEQLVQDFMKIHGWDRPYSISDSEELIEFFMTRGVGRSQAEDFVRLQGSIAEYFKKIEEKAFLHVQGLMIVYGRK